MTIAMPDWLKAAQVEWSLERASVTHTSQTTRLTQIVDLMSWQWRLMITLPPALLRESGKFEALANRLVGGADTIAMHHIARPVPIGTMRGTPTLNATAGQFANQIQIAGAWDTSRQNLVAHGGAFANAAWAKLAVTLASGATDRNGGTSAFTLSETTANSGHYIYQEATVSVGQTYTFSVYAKAGSHSVIQVALGGVAYPSTLWANVNVLTGAVGSKSVGGSVVVSGDLGGGWRRVSITAAASGGTTAAVYVLLTNDNPSAVVGVSYAGNTASNVLIDDAQFEIGSSATDFISTGASASYAAGTLNSGDMIGLSGQLLQVADDAVSNDSGVMTVNLVNRLRSSVTAGASVVWNRPTAEFYMLDTRARSTYSPGIGGGQAFEFVERVA